MMHKLSLDVAFRKNKYRIFIYLLSIASAFSFFVTFFFASTKTLNPLTIRRIAGLICLDLIFLVGLVILISRYFAQLWAQRKEQHTGARLHARLVTIFGISAALPTLAMIVFAVFSFHNGVQAWFTDKTQSILQQSLAVANGYLAEQKKVMRADAELIAQALGYDLITLGRSPYDLQDKLETMLGVRSVDEGMILDQKLDIVVKSHLAFTLQFETLTPHALKEAELYPVVLTGERADRLRALIALPTDPVVYLYVGRFVDPQILGYLEATHGAVSEYQVLEKHQGKFSVFFALVMVAVGVLVVLCSVGFALVIADQMIQPISHLMEASERVRAGDLTARVPVGIRSYELSLLSRTFNRMVRQMAWQQKALMDTNQALEVRKNLLQTVLAGVRSGVIGLDHHGLLLWPNQTASQLLHIDLEAHLQRPLEEVVPEFAVLFKSINQPTSLHVQAEISRACEGITQILFVRMAAHATLEGQIEGYVVTFDDMTHILEAERQATWSEAAKRVAHEIKNPLTPIRLAAERLGKKWTSSSPKEEELLRQCTDTIMRQVDAIGRMVDTFSGLARMPVSTMQIVALDKILQDTMVLHKMAHHEMHFDWTLSGIVRPVVCDRTSITQVFNNIFLNAIQSIQSRQKQEPNLKGRLQVFLTYQDQDVKINIEDNGEGLSCEKKDRLTEPYVTTKIDGTGLGLSIVKKIMDEHKGSLSLIDCPERGVCVTLVLPYGDPHLNLGP